MQKEVRFGSGDQKVKVFRGQTVRITADSAYVISSDRARLLNEKLKELEAAHQTNTTLANVNDELLTKVRQIEGLVSQLLRRMEGDAEAVNLDMEQILAELDRSLQVLKENNERLEQNNTDLNHQIADMKRTVKLLKKEIRGIWWNGIADKIVAGGMGLGAGLLLAGL